MCVVNVSFKLLQEQNTIGRTESKSGNCLSRRLGLESTLRFGSTELGSLPEAIFPVEQPCRRHKRIGTRTGMVDFIDIIAFFHMFYTVSENDQTYVLECVLNLVP